MGVRPLQKVGKGGTHICRGGRPGQLYWASGKQLTGLGGLSPQGATLSCRHSSSASGLSAAPQQGSLGGRGVCPTVSLTFEKGHWGLGPGFWTARGKAPLPQVLESRRVDRNKGQRCCLGVDSPEGLPLSPGSLAAGPAEAHTGCVSCPSLATGTPRRGLAPRGMNGCSDGSKNRRQATRASGKGETHPAPVQPH